MRYVYSNINDEKKNSLIIFSNIKNKLIYLYIELLKIINGKEVFYEQEQNH